MPNYKRKKENKNYVDCSRLSVGMVIDNYTKICQILGENKKGGESKKAQLKRWQRFFKFEQNGHKFVILEIYKNPLPDTDKRKNKFGTYSGYIRFLLLKCVLQQKDNCLLLPKYQWWELLGMTNGNFKEYLPQKDREISKDHNLKVAESEKKRFSDLEKKIAERYNLPIDGEDVSFFYEIAKKKLREILNNALASLKNRRLIKCDEVFVIRMKDGSSETVGSNEKKLISEIVDLQNQALHNIGFEQYSDVVAADQTFRYYKMLQLLIESTHTVKDQPEKSWHNVYEYTQIVFSKNRKEVKRQLFQTVEELIQNDALETENKRNLNNNVISALSDIINTSWGKPNPMDIVYDDDNIADDGDNIANDQGNLTFATALSYNERFKHKVRTKDNFVEIQNSLVDYLISIDN